MKMRKVLSALLVAACTLSLAACGSSSSKNETTGASGETAAGSANTAKVIDVDLTSEEYAFGVDKTQPELLEQTNTFIQKIKDDGTLDAICANFIIRTAPVEKLGAIKQPKLFLFESFSSSSI